MSPVSIPQSKLSAVSRNRKAKVSREQTTMACAQVLLLPQAELGSVSHPHPQEDKERASPTPNISLPAPLPATARMISSQGRPASPTSVPKAAGLSEEPQDSDSLSTALRCGYVFTFNKFSLTVIYILQV